MQHIKTLLKKIRPIVILGQFFRIYYYRFFGNNKWSGVSCRRIIVGKNNNIKIGEHSSLAGTTFRIYGSGNNIVVGKSVRMTKGCNIWIDGDNHSITIGDNSTFNHSVHICAQEIATTIRIGKDCQFANTIIIRTSDSHPIYNEQEERINPPKDVEIGNHVWVCPHSTIMKNCKIGDGSIIGSNSVVTKDVPPYSLAVGTPAHVVKQNIRWERT